MLKEKPGLELKYHMLSKLFKRIRYWIWKQLLKWGGLIVIYLKRQKLFFKDFSFSRDNIRNHLTNKAVTFFGFQEMKKSGGWSKPKQRHFRFNNKSDYKGPNSVNGLAEKFYFRKRTKKIRQNYYEPAK